MANYAINMFLDFLINFFLIEVNISTNEEQSW